MSNVLVCVKRVPETSSQVVLTDDEQAVDGRYVGFTTSNHESCAIELAVTIAEATGGEATVLTLGPTEATEQLRNALALGCAQATLIEAELSKYGPADVAREIAAVINDHESAGRTHDLILLGNDAADSGDFQVGIRLAYELGRPVVNGVDQVSVSDGQITAKGKGPGGDETYRLPTPAVVTVLEGGVEPRYPTLKGRMSAKKVAIEERTAVGEPQGARRVKLKLPPPAPSTVTVLGEGPEAAPAVVDTLFELGVLR